MTNELRNPTGYGRASKGTGMEIPELDDDMYDASIKDVMQGTSTYEGVDSEQYVVEFELADRVKANGEPVTLRGYVRIPPTLVSDGVVNEKSKLYEFLRALGYTDEDLEVDPSSWQGESLRLIVENKEIKSGDNKGQVRPRVTGYKPKRKAAAPVREAVAAAPVAAKRSAKPAADQGEDF